MTTEYMMNFSYWTNQRTNDPTQPEVENPNYATEKRRNQRKNPYLERRVREKKKYGTSLVESRVPVERIQANVLHFVAKYLFAVWAHLHTK